MLPIIAEIYVHDWAKTSQILRDYLAGSNVPKPQSTIRST
eukprot:Gb_11737 [translate_table: standard]